MSKHAYLDESEIAALCQEDSGSEIDEGGIELTGDITDTSGRYKNAIASLFLSVLLSVNRLMTKNFQQHVPATAKDKHPSRYCKSCSEMGLKTTGKRVRRKTRLWRADCGVVLYLLDCF
jgi:hypothetical protein